MKETKMDLASEADLRAELAASGPKECWLAQNPERFGAQRHFDDKGCGRPRAVSPLFQEPSKLSLMRIS